MNPVVNAPTSAPASLPTLSPMLADALPDAYAAPLANTAQRFQEPSIHDSTTAHATSALVKGLLDTGVDHAVDVATAAGQLTTAAQYTSAFGTAANVITMLAPDGSNTHAAAELAAAADVGTAIRAGLSAGVDAAAIGMSAATGDIGAAMRQADRLEDANLNGQNGPMMQGYAMAVTLATDPDALVDRLLSPDAAEGGMGSAVRLGNQLGDLLFRTLHGEHLALTR